MKTYERQYCSELGHLKEKIQGPVTSHAYVAGHSIGNKVKGGRFLNHYR